MNMGVGGGLTFREETRGQKITPLFILISH
jgi:hypothetical protein